jgi:peptide/nickel transport system substrate-binding protein
MATRILMILLVLTLVLALACGSAAPEPTPVPDPTATQAEDAAPADESTVAPVVSEASQPTPTPQIAAPPTEVEVHPGKVTWMTADFGTERFDSIHSSTGLDYMRQIHAILVSSDIDDEGRRVMAPGIATNWEISSDGLTWILTIREGVKFHDGSDLTAEDVLWTLQHSIGPQAKDWSLSAPGIAFSTIMEQIEQTEPDQVSVTTEIPISDFPGTMSEAYGGSIGIVIPKRDTLHDIQEEEAYDRNPIGAGVMKFVSHTPAEVMSFERFDDYYQQPENGFPEDKRASFQSMDLFMVPEEATRVAALRSGAADIVPASLATREQVEAGGGRLVFGPEGGTVWVRFLGCWKSEYPCQDQRVRQALAYAIDKELIRDQLYGPEVFQVKGWAVVTPSTIGYSSDLVPFPYDPDKARQLLADAGYPGGEGFGKLIINTYNSRTAPFLVESAQIGADMWRRELGLEVEVRVQDDAALKEAVSLTEDHFGQVLWRDQDARVDAAALLRSNYGTYYPPETDQKKDRAHEDPELRAFIQEAIGVFDPIEREKALNNAYQRVRDEAYWVSVGYLNVPWGVGPRIQTWEPYPLATYPSALHTVTLQ